VGVFLTVSYKQVFLIQKVLAKVIVIGRAFEVVKGAEGAWNPFGMLLDLPDQVNRTPGKDAFGGVEELAVQPRVHGKGRVFNHFVGGCCGVLEQL